MSRLIVKNLPKNITDTRLKELFSKEGIVTDVQLKYTKDGKFRRFAFIGYKTEEQAELAQSYFNQTCIDTCKIIVEKCANLGDPTKPKSWSKYAIDSSYNANQDSKLKRKRTDSADETDIRESKSSKKKKKKNKSADKKENSEIKQALEKHKDDPLFMEFLETHAGNNIKDILEDDNVPVETAEKSDNKDFKSNKDTTESESEDKEEQENKGEEKITSKVTSDLEYMEALKKKSNIKEEKSPNTSKYGPVSFFTVKVRGLRYTHIKKHIKQLFRPLKANSIRLPRKVKGIAYVGFKTEMQMKKALLKNKSYLDGKQIFVSKYERKETTESNNNSDNRTNVKWKKQEEALKEEESIAESGRIFIRNLTYTTTEDDIRKLFEKYGPLTEVNLPVDRVTKKPKGFGTVTFLMPEHAIRAHTELDGSVQNGRMLHILPGKAKNSLENIDTENLTYKQKELQIKANEGLSHNWNTLFLGQNAVANDITNTCNTTKKKVLEDGSKRMSSAVNVALGETQLIQKTREFLEQNGVCLDAFNQPSKQRSRTIMLVKNLTTRTKPKQIRNLFAKHGELGRVVIPPACVTALVEFLEPSEARKAFLRLAYTYFKNLPLYLEWAPENSFTTPTSKADVSRSETSKSKNLEKIKETEILQESKENEKSAKKKDDVDEDDEEPPPEPDTTLFVKNINLSTTPQQFKDHFSKCGRLHDGMISGRRDPKNPSNIISMGFGFIRYMKKADADRALKTLQMTVLDGKSLELKRSETKVLEACGMKRTRKKSNITAQTGTTILVRNVPFQADPSEIRDLFKAFGEVKTVRLPKKFGGPEKHKGFGFVEFYTKSEAKKAFAALCQSTHLYGRRLVLEWAKMEEDIDEIRKRTAKRFYQNISTNTFKKAMLDPENVGLEKDT